MTSLAMRATGAGLLILLGVLLGIWSATAHFRPLLDAEQNQMASCKAARENLSGLAAEQGKALGDLILAAKARQAGADQAVGKAKASAEVDYVAANRLQQERTGGDQCAAAILIIDKELGL
ncbi:hypothetical protein [Pseudomonas putida]|uniref:Lysozyme n=1 Tax=Pseudomonas putida TaxID=303 RepID=A0AAW4BU74_PSEPU|nr:hypothetical protein [Pseudomonas putida]MBF8703002.1 hypothetical protein [Pseudomonas putida]MBF8736858.1 hypothetical protein [Pseudomonas putida]